ncbi:MAG TPA: LamG-like jellyroll fold domain-containing protein [Verrucomicrobiae bacterium]|nr:LamG-like jellyroll fold domain-containing protein [Verrucomicrobiae bacterium]
MKRHATALALALASYCAGAQTNVGQWDFTSSNLTATVGGLPLQFADQGTQFSVRFGTTASFSIAPLNGTNASVLYFPALGATGGLVMPTDGLQANGGGSLANEYTIVMDVLYPATSSAHVRPLVQTDDAVITPNADLVVDASGGIGAPPGPYSGSILPNTWYRLAFSVTASSIDIFINGVEVGSQGSDGLDGEFALAQPGTPPPSGYALLFQNSTTNGAAPGYVSSIQLWDGALSPGQIAALGAPSSTKIPTNIASIPSFVTAKVPSPNANNVSPVLVVSGVVNPGATVVDGNSIALYLDNTLITASITNTGSNYIFSANPTNVLLPFSAHSVAVIYSDSVVGKITNAWTFTTFGYQNVTLPAPIYLETFDELTEGSLPAGWTVTNHTDSLTSGLDLTDSQSDSYKNWVTINVSNYPVVYPDKDNYTSPGFPNISGNRRLMHPPIVENGVFLTNLASGNLIVAESDQRGGNQVQALITRDYDFTGRSNIYVSFHHLNEQNQDNMCSLEYSIDQGTNWLPILYMLDDGTTDSDGSDIIYNKATGLIDVSLTMNTARHDQAWGESYGSYIAAPITQALAPYIRPCRNDDPVQQKRIEVFGLPAAAEQSHVRLRFMQAGTGSWFFDVDNVGFYSIPEPIILEQPAPVVADFNGPAGFVVQAGGDNLAYQWAFGATNLTDATNATFNIANTTSNNIGLYTVKVSNQFGSVTSAPIQLSLVFTPVILTTPQDLTIAPSDPATFTVSARGGQPLSYQWLVDSNIIVGATNASFSLAAADVTNSGFYQVSISNQFSVVVSHPAELTVYAGPITNDLVVHLTFDTNFADSSGRGNNATAVNTPTIEPGFLGNAVHTKNNGVPANAPSTNNYLTLGYPTDLQFGSDYGGSSADFSVSFWVKILEQNDDQSFIGNKDWNSGGNPGWIIDTESDGMKWNYADNAVNLPGVGSPRRDSPHVAPQLEDGGWHHVLVTFARHSVGTIYVDGALANVQPLAPDPGQIGGSIETLGLGYSINIGQDGTGHYTDNGSASHVDMLMDDLAIWRRVLNSHEATGIFNAGLNGMTVDEASINSVGAKPKVQVQPLDASGGPGSSVNFYAGALGSPTLTYQWQFNSVSITNATNSSYMVTNVLSSLAGGYSVIVSNSYGADTSRVAVLSYIPAPAFTGVPAGEVVDVGATVALAMTPANGAQPITYAWLHDYTNLVVGSSATNLVLSNVQFADAGIYQLVAFNNFGASTSAPALLKVWSGAITNGLVAHLTFDDTLADSSGRGNNATYAVNGPSNSPTPRFVPGILGQAFEYTTTANGSNIEYATFGYPTDLQFDSTNDFSVSFWANFTNQSDDLPIIGNKDWGSASNPGWVITTQTGGNARVNVTGATGNDKYSQTDFPRILKNGAWHNIVVSVQHEPAPFAANLSCYVDGVLVSKHPLTAVGSVDTVALAFGYTNDLQSGWAVNIGQDGTGLYTDGGGAYDIDAKIDDLGIWRRALTANEAAGIYLAGTLGKDLTHAASAVLFANVSGGNIVLTWAGSAGVELQTAPTLGAAWVSVNGTRGASTASMPLSSGATAYFRLVKVQ